MNEEQKENVVVPEQNTNTDFKKDKKKKEKIPKKPKEEKKPKEPMDKKDLLCYIGALIFFVLAFLPLLIRTFDASYSENNNPFKEETEESDEEVEVKNTLTCNKTITAVGYSYTENVINTYVNSSIVGNVITYTINLNSDSEYTMDDVVIEEYSSLSTIESDGVNIEINDNVYVVRIDYNMDNSLKNNTLLDNHNKAISVQQINYESNGYTCIKE